MFLDLAETQILAHAGWGDDYHRLWRYDIATGQEEKIEHFSNGFNIREGSDHRHLLLVDRPQPGAHRCTIRSVAQPLRPLATAVHERGRWTFEGDAQLWEGCAPGSRRCGQTTEPSCCTFIQTIRRWIPWIGTTTVPTTSVIKGCSNRARSPAQTC